MSITIGHDSAHTPTSIKQTKDVSQMSNDELRAMGGMPVLAEILAGVFLLALIGIGIFFAFNPVLALLLLLVFSVLSALSGAFFFVGF